MHSNDTGDRNAASVLRPCCRRALICVLAAAGLMIAAPVASAGAHNRHHHHNVHAKLHPSPRIATPAPCINADASVNTASVTTMDVAVDCLVNQRRVQHGISALTVSSKLTSSAQRWNDAMVASGDFTHGSDFGGRISAVGYDWQTAGENIATGYLTPTQVVAAWMASPDHCRNILDPSFRNVGTGETPSPVGGWASGPATWTQDFGLLMSQSAMSGNHTPQNGCPYR